MCRELPTVWVAARFSPGFISLFYSSNSKPGARKIRSALGLELFDNPECFDTFTAQAEQVLRTDVGRVFLGMAVTLSCLLQDLAGVCVLVMTPRQMKQTTIVLPMKGVLFLQIKARTLGFMTSKLEVVSTQAFHPPTHKQKASLPLQKQLKTTRTFTWHWGEITKQFTVISL